jgi:hypothetical protein
MQPGNWLGRARAGAPRVPLYRGGGGAHDPRQGRRGEAPVGQSRPLDTPLARVCDKPMLAWALSQGLIEVNADGSWQLTEVALEWLRYQPLKARNAAPSRLRDLPCPDRYDA